MTDTPPREQTATEAMNLRPRARPGPPPATARERTAAAIDALEQQLADLVTALEAMHRPLELSALAPLCRECLLPHPCRTLRLVHPGADTPTPPERNDT